MSDNELRMSSDELRIMNDGNVILDGDNAILKKSKAFAVRIIRLYKYLTETKKECIIAKQLLRSGTSVGANVRESQRGQNTKDFLTKLYIAEKEADETAYWLELLHETEYLNDKEFSSVYPDCEELIRLLASIIISTKSRMENS